MTPASSPHPILSLSQVSKTFGRGDRAVAALKNVTLAVKAQGITGLIGPDGAGKTTLMRLCCGLLKPDQGEIFALNIDVIKTPLLVQASVGYMPQRFGLYEDLSVQENLNLYADLQGVPKAQRPGRYTELMHMTGLSPFTKRLAGRLSGGMKQKLGLACTLVRPPRLLILDEPTVGVDPVSRRELWAIVARLVESEGMTVLLSTAYLDEAERCSEIILLHEGQVLGQEPPEAFRRPMTGRTFSLACTEGKRRALQDQLANAPEILDAIIHKDGLRLVTQEPNPPDLSAICPEDFGDLQAKPTPPRFEDAYVARLTHKKTQVPEKNSQSQCAPPSSSVEPGPAIMVRDLSKRFGAFTAVDSISFEVRRGEVFGLLGANGAGKSTTFRMLCGLLPATSGSLSVAGHDLRHARAEARARIGYMSQKFSLYGKLTVLQNLEFFSKVYGLEGAQRTERMTQAMERFDLAPFAKAASQDLSLGYKQRLALACALMHDPDILFLDEPTSGVDPVARREFWQHINELAAKSVTVLVTTHFMEEAEYCDRLVIMDAGKVLAEGAPSEIKSLARSADTPQPTIEDAFIFLVERSEYERRVA